MSKLVQEENVDYPKIENINLEFCWCTIYYNGFINEIISGIIKYKENQYWFEVCDEFVSLLSNFEKLNNCLLPNYSQKFETTKEEIGGRNRKYFIYKLNTEEFNKEQNNNNILMETKDPKIIYNIWYNQYHKRNYKNNEKIGWFEI